jgi:alkanesulfonate monooxygenase SsuD/methylene tetrahydromethanopterin reductase-like flavin-dependent oxidoreductase (luciferase family)
VAGLTRVSTRTPIPIGVNPTTIGVSAAWWLEAALRVEAAGFRTAWAWDHFVTFARDGRLRDPVLECWTLLAAVAAATRTLRVGSFVSNVMNRHPALLAREAATVADLAGAGDRLELGIGIGGHPAEHAAYGMEFPEARDRAARLEEALSVLRLLLGGGPVDFDGTFYRMRAAHAFPVPQPRPRLIVGAETRAGARIAARSADAMTTFGAHWERVYAAFLVGLEAAGRSRADVSVLLAIDVDPDAANLRDLGALASRWQEKGADELILHWVRPVDLDAVLAAGERANS